MADRTAPPSRPRRRTTDAAAGGVDVRGWLGNLRLSGFMVIMMGLVVLAAFVLVPTIGTYVSQRQQIAALQDAVSVTADEVSALEAQQEQWKDSAYITAQARERLYYTRPGEVLYLVIDDLPASLAPQDKPEVSDTVEQTRSDWMAQLVRSVTESGLAQTAVPVQIGVPDPAPAPTG
ncbi:hypothetical protein CVS47_01960 [Microbacterium lemovicicum]|uniref:Cell division protein FtsL n=1 Tax=Microbacterium lemovicicum TaxID=1072463 RepID=A0A3Q9IZA4_9MICO|nr:septum formation initiator family protein [Microbacterium lemovicicum]AZS37325.1 hypothetical protein CVS47_01960 [Microbacterium lemovicicum]